MQNISNWTILKLTLAYLEDCELFKQIGRDTIPAERQAQVITGKVQDAILKQEAAIAVRLTYRSILGILEKVLQRFS